MFVREQIYLIWHVFDFTHGNKFQFPVHFSDQSNPSKQKSWKTYVSLICFTSRLLWKWKCLGMLVVILGAKNWKLLITLNCWNIEMPFHSE